MAWSAIPVLAATDPFDKPLYDIVKGDLEYLKGDAGWTAVTFAANWSNLGGGFHNCEFKMVGDFVVLRGCAKTAAGAGATIFTLPVGYRPAANEHIAVENNNAFGFLAIGTDGKVNPNAVPAAGGYVFLDNVRIPVV